MMSTMAVMLAPGYSPRSGFYRIGEGLVMPCTLRAIGRDIDRVGRLCDESQMPVEILGEISQIETFASGSGIRENRQTAQDLWPRPLAQTQRDRSHTTGRWLCSFSRTTLA
jgi:hypothetical protein